MQDWNLADQIAGLENARLENAGPENRYPLHVVAYLFCRHIMPIEIPGNCKLNYPPENV